MFSSLSSIVHSPHIMPKSQREKRVWHALLTGKAQRCAQA